MEEKKQIIISDELDNLVYPWITYLIENYNNPNKVNSCLDVASDNIRMLESLIHQAESRLKDFKALKKLTLMQEQKRKDMSKDTQSPPTLAD